MEEKGSLGFAHSLTSVCVCARAREASIVGFPPWASSFPLRMKATIQQWATEPYKVFGRRNTNGYEIFW